MPVFSPARVSPAQLREIGLFGGLEQGVLQHLCGLLVTTQLDAGFRIFEEGDAAREMYVVLSGEIEVLKRSRSGTDARVALLGPGDWFGEMGLVDIQARSATVRAVAPTELLRLTGADLDDLYRHDLRAYAMVILNLARQLSRRLRVADSILAEFVANLHDSYLRHH